MDFPILMPLPMPMWNTRYVETVKEKPLEPTITFERKQELLAKRSHIEEQMLNCDYDTYVDLKATVQELNKVLAAKVV